MNDTAALADARGHHARGIGLMLFSTACFTANVLLIRALGQVQQVNIWLISCARFIVGLVVLSTMYRQDVRFRRVFTRGALAGRGIVGGLGVAVYYLTVVHLGAGRATFINNTYIILGAVMAVFILREHFRRSLVAGSIAAMAGLSLLTNAFAADHATWRYDLLAILCAFGSAYVVVTIRVLHRQGEHTATIFAAQCIYGLLICAWPAVLQWAPISGTAALLLVIAGLCAAAGQLAMTRAFRDLSVAEGSLLQILVPLGIAAGGMGFFGERLAVHEWIGAALILAGTVFTVLRR